MIRKRSYVHDVTKFPYFLRQKLYRVVSNAYRNFRMFNFERLYDMYDMYDM